MTRASVAKAVKQQPLSVGEETLAQQLRAERFAFIRQYKPIPDRKFAFDFYVAPDLLIEVNGGTWAKGNSGHSSGTGLARDAEKVSLAAAYGFRVIVATTDQVKRGNAIDWIRRANQHGIQALRLKGRER